MWFIVPDPWVDTAAISLEEWQRVIDDTSQTEETDSDSLFPYDTSDNIYRDTVDANDENSTWKDALEDEC